MNRHFAGIFFWLREDRGGRKTTHERLLQLIVLKTSVDFIREVQNYGINGGLSEVFGELRKVGLGVERKLEIEVELEELRDRV